MDEKFEITGLHMDEHLQTCLIAFKHVNLVVTIRCHNGNKLAQDVSHLSRRCRFFGHSAGHPAGHLDGFSTSTGLVSDMSCCRKGC